MVAASFFYSWASMTLGKMIFQKMGIKDIPMLPALERWEMPRPVLYVYIAVVVAGYFLKPQGMMDYVLYNVEVGCVLIVLAVRGLRRSGGCRTSIRGSVPSAC